MAEHSLETKIALLELQVKQLNDILIAHMAQETETTNKIFAELQALQRSAWVVGGLERLGWLGITAIVGWFVGNRQ